MRVYAGLDLLSGHKRWRYDHARSEVEARARERWLLAEVEQAHRQQAQTVAVPLARWVKWAEQVQGFVAEHAVGYRH